MAPVIAKNRVHVLYQNKKIRRAFLRVLKPIFEKVGSSKFVAYFKKETDRQEVTSEEARVFDFNPDDDVGQEALPAQTVQAWLRAYSPVYDPTAKSWRLWYGQDRYYMDVSESDLVPIALENGGVLTNDMFRVNLEITQDINHKGDIINRYKVKEVLEFRKGERQADLFLEGASGDPLDEV